MGGKRAPRRGATQRLRGEPEVRTVEGQHSSTRRAVLDSPFWMDYPH